MANWSNPQLTSTYTNFVTEVKERDVDLALQFDGTTSTSIPTGTIRWNSSINRWQKWSGSAWGELTSTYALNALSVSGTTTLGTATATTPATADDSTKIATTAWVKAQAYAQANNIVDADVSPTAAIASTKLSFTQSGTGATARTVQTKLRDVVSAKDFGAVGDNATNDTTAIINALATGPAYLPSGTYVSTVLNKATLTGTTHGPRTYGLGQIKTADTNKTAANFAHINAAPSSFGVHSSVDTAFNGDLSKCQFAVEHRITGAATLGQPTTGYTYTPEAYPHYTDLCTSSGHNQGTATNEGRTGAAAYRTSIFQNGQGDAVCYNGSVFVTGTKVGSTHFLANPAGVLFNGNMEAGANGIYFNPYETICSDNGYDVACVGIVNNFNRTNATGAKSTTWLGYRAQSVGSASCDAMVSGTGKWITGLDFAMSGLDFGTNKAAISLKANDRIYLNNAANASGNLGADWRTTVFNGDYIEYNTSGYINFVRSGTSYFQIATGAVRVISANLSVNPANVAGAGAIIAGRQTGFGLPTGTYNTAAFDTSTVTLTQLAQYVAGMMSRLHSSGGSGTHWLFGP
jgi:hypothetical protein